MRRLFRAAFLVAAVSSVLAASPVLAQTAPAGVVTAVQGTALIARAATNESGPLRFKDGVFLYDRITTGEHSLARILLGGKAVVTARERSTVTITAVPGATTLELKHGRLLLAVAKGTVRAGESIDIKTRNAIIGIRGTVVVADFVPGKALDGSADATTFTILRGAVEVTQLDPLAARGRGAPLRLGALQSVKVTGTRAPELTAISRQQAKQMTEGFSVPVRPTPSTTKEVADLRTSQMEPELGASATTPVSSGESTLGSSPSKGKDKDSTKAGGSTTSNSKTPAGITSEIMGPVSAVTGTSSETVSNVTGGSKHTPAALNPAPTANNGVSGDHQKKAGSPPK